MHLPHNLAESFLEKRRLASLQSPPRAASQPLPKVFEKDGLAISVLDQHGLANLGTITLDSTGELYFFVLVNKTPMSMQIFGRKRMWVFGDIEAAKRQFRHCSGQSC